MDHRAAERRVLEAVGGRDLIQVMADLPGADLTTLLLAVARARVERLSPADVLRAYAQGRFVVPARVPFGALRRAEEAFLSALGDEWKAIVLSPLVPFGTHATTGELSQDRVVSTIRGSEVAADPTNGLCLEIAARRRRARREPTRLATIQRIVRAQRFEGAPSHFSIFALVTGGRDVGSLRFESEALAEHVSIHVQGVRAAGARSVRILLTDLTNGEQDSVLSDVAGGFDNVPDVLVERDPDRTDGRHYYESFCFKMRADLGEGEFEVSDGGFVGWTASLLQDRKERLCISGSGLDNVASSIK